MLLLTTKCVDKKDKDGIQQQCEHSFDTLNYTAQRLLCHKLIELENKTSVAYKIILTEDRFAFHLRLE